MQFPTSYAINQNSSAKGATTPAPKAEAGLAPEAFKDFAATLRQSEAVAQDSLVTDADPTALVQALAQIELAVDTAVTIRDKVIEAYQEILRMPV